MDYQSSTESQQIHNTDKTLKSSSTRQFIVSVTELENDKDLNANNQPTIDAPDLIIFDIEKTTFRDQFYNSQNYVTDKSKNTRSSKPYKYKNLESETVNQFHNIEKYYQELKKNSSITKDALLELKYNLLSTRPADPQVYIGYLAAFLTLIALSISIFNLLNISEPIASKLTVLSIVSLIIVSLIIMLVMMCSIIKTIKSDNQTITLINYQLEKVNQLLEEKTEN